MTKQKEVLTFGHDHYGFPIVPQKVHDWHEAQRKEEEDRKRRAEARAERAKNRAERLQAKREAAERRKEWEDRRYQREIDRLHREWEAKIAAQKWKEEHERAAAARSKAMREQEESAKRMEAQKMHVAEMERRGNIWEHSVARIEARRQHHIDPDLYQYEGPMSERIAPRCGELWYEKYRRWLYRGDMRITAAIEMASHLGQLRSRRHTAGRGPRPPQKQPHGWKARTPRSWSRRKHVEAKWNWCFEG